MQECNCCPVESRCHCRIAERVLGQRKESYCLCERIAAIAEAQFKPLIAESWGPPSECVRQKKDL